MRVQASNLERFLECYCWIVIIVAFIVLFSPNLKAADATLAWDPNTESNLAGYRLYYGTSPRTYSVVVDVGNVTTYTVTNLTSETWYFALTAYNTSNRESGFSNEVFTGYTGTMTPPAFTPVLTIDSISGGNNNETYHRDIHIDLLINGPAAPGAKNGKSSNFRPEQPQRNETLHISSNARGDVFCCRP